MRDLRAPLVLVFLLFISSNLLNYMSYCVLMDKIDFVLITSYLPTFYKEGYLYNGTDYYDSCTGIDDCSYELCMYNVSYYWGGNHTDCSTSRNAMIKRGNLESLDKQILIVYYSLFISLAIYILSTGLIVIYNWFKDKKLLFILLTATVTIIAIECGVKLYLIYIFNTIVKIHEELPVFISKDERSTSYSFIAILSVHIFLTIVAMVEYSMYVSKEKLSEVRPLSETSTLNDSDNEVVFRKG